VSDADDSLFPPAEEEEYELRFTRRALDDLGCPATIGPGNFEAIVASTPYSAMVDLFKKKRLESPCGAERPMRKVGRGDIYALRGPAGGRGATWYDEENRVCWFLGLSPEHDFELLERRAASGTLLPDEDDLTVLFDARDSLTFDQIFGSSMRLMYREATTTPGIHVARTVHGLLQIEVLVIETTVDEYLMRDIYISARIPPLTDERPEGWPGRLLAERLIELAVGCASDRLNLEYPEFVPANDESLRKVEWQDESCVKACSLAFLQNDPFVLVNQDE